MTPAYALVCLLWIATTGAAHGRRNLLLPTEPLPSGPTPSNTSSNSPHQAAHGSTVWDSKISLDYGIMSLVIGISYRQVLLPAHSHSNNSSHPASPIKNPPHAHAHGSNTQTSPHPPSAHHNTSSSTHSAHERSHAPSSPSAQQHRLQVSLLSCASLLPTYHPACGNAQVACLLSIIQPATLVVHTHGSAPGAHDRTSPTNCTTTFQVCMYVLVCPSLHVRLCITTYLTGHGSAQRPGTCICMPVHPLGPQPV